MKLKLVLGTSQGRNVTNKFHKTLKKNIFRLFKQEIVLKLDV